MNDKSEEIGVSDDAEVSLYPETKSTFVDKPDFLLKITGKLEIDFNDKINTIKDFEIEAKTLEILIRKLLYEINKISLNKLHEALQFLIEKGSEK